MTLDAARAILGFGKRQRPSFTGHSETERAAFERRLAQLRAQRPLEESLPTVGLRIRARWL